MKTYTTDTLNDQDGASHLNYLNTNGELLATVTTGSEYGDGVFIQREAGPEVGEYVRMRTFPISEGAALVESLLASAGWTPATI